MVEAIECRGGAVFIRTPVSSILTDATTGAACGVRLSTGEELRARRVVSALGYRATESLLGVTSPSATPSATPSAPASSPPRLHTQQSAGFVMANVALRGTAASLGISAANTWLQPANKANGYDALKGERAYFADPLGVDLALVPVGITFPSAKESCFVGGVEEELPASGEEPYHTCQILALAEYSWFEKWQPVDPQGLGQKGSRHAPPHVARKDQAAVSIR